MSDETTTCRHDVMTLACAMCRGEYVADLRSQLATLTAENAKLTADVEIYEGLNRQRSEVINQLSLAEAERDRLKAALEEWTCGCCDGSKLEGPHRPGEACSCCDGTGLDPTARAALAAPPPTPPAGSTKGTP